MKNNFANNFKHLRIQSGKTQEEIGKMLNKDYSTIGKWELGQRSPSMEDVIKIAEYFDVTLQELISGDIETSINKDNLEKYKQILRSKGLMDENDNIDEESFNKLIMIADIIKRMNKGEEK